MDTIGKYQRQVNKLKKVINEDEYPNLARSHQEQLDEALTNLENATTAYAKRATRQSARIAKRKVRTFTHGYQTKLCTAVNLWDFALGNKRKFFSPALRLFKSILL